MEDKSFQEQLAAQADRERRVQARNLLLHTAAAGGMGSLIAQAFHRPLLLIPIVLIVPWLLASSPLVAGTAWPVLWRHRRRQ